jgi:hypothetical protein
MAWIVGQENRVVIATPANCGELQVDLPTQLEMIDRWPWREDETRQRFYLRAKQPLAGGVIGFRAGPYSLHVPIEILSWAEAEQPRWFEQWQLPRIFPLEGTDEPKQGITFLEERDLQRLRVKGRAGIEKLVEALPDDEKVYYALPEATFPRAVFVGFDRPTNRVKGCPVCGDKIFERRDRYYPWLWDPVEHPWKVGCPACGEWFPSNDFAAGDRHSGEFPDDGWGYFQAGEDSPYNFIGYYVAHTYMHYYAPTCSRLCEEYARSGDRRIGHTAALMLFRIAEQYKSLALNLNMRVGLTREALFQGRIVPQSEVSVYSTGLYTEHYWEPDLHARFATAFEQLWDFFNQDDPELLAFLQAHHHPEIQTMEDVRRAIEVGYLRTIAQSCLDQNIVGNLPAGQRCMVNSALVLNSPRSIDLMQEAFDGWGMMRFFLPNSFFIDGSAYESTGSYNRIHVRGIDQIVQATAKMARLNPERYRPDKFPRLSDDPKYRQVFDFCLNFNLIGRTDATTGDGGILLRNDPLPRRLTSDSSPEDFLVPYSATQDHRFAKVLFDPLRRSAIPQVTDPQMRQQVEQVVAEEGWEIDLQSNVLDGYGHAILRSGEGDDRRTLWIRYGRARNHAHNDMLNIGMEGKRRKFLPDFGYNSGGFQKVWDRSWVTHYSSLSVGVPSGRGHCKLFADGPWARVATAYSPAHRRVDPPEVYQLLGGQGQERTIALIDLDEKDSYAVDITYVDGGTEHYWSFHSPRIEADAQVEGLSLVLQPGGTMAGPEHGFDQRGKWWDENPELRGFLYLFEVSRAETSAPWSLDWALEGYPDIHLRLTTLPYRQTEVALARGKRTILVSPPEDEMQWVIQHAAGAEPQHSRFVDVLEVYEGARLLSNVRRLNVQTSQQAAELPVAMRVKAASRVDTIIASRQPQRCQAQGITSDGVFAVWSEKGGVLEAAYLVGGKILTGGETGLESRAAQWRGFITAVDYGRRSVMVHPAAPHPAGLAGRYVRFQNESSDCTHLIMMAENQGDTCRLTLELDPRIGEGLAVGNQPNGLRTASPLYLAGWRYYHGKTLSNEDGSVCYRLGGATRCDGRFGDYDVWIDPLHHGAIEGHVLEKEFVDKDGDGLKRFVIYDYGVGDEAVVTFGVSLYRTDSQRWRLQTPVPVTIRLPGLQPAQIHPAEDTQLDSLTYTSHGPDGGMIQLASQ